MRRVATGLMLATLAAQPMLAQDQAPAAQEQPSSPQEQAPVPMIVIEGMGREAVPAAAATPSVLIRDATEKARPTPPLLLPLRPVFGRVGPDHLARLQGQRGEQSFRLVLPPTGLGGTLTLAQMSSINVLPEASEIVVLLNGAELGSFRPESFSSLNSVAFPLQGSSARAGENIVTLRAKQRHRIYCGPDASFALWTDIDLSQSGVQLEAAAVRPDTAGFVAALAAQAGLGRPLEIRGAAVSDAALRSIAMTLGQTMGGAALPLTAASPWDMAEGPALARVALIPSDRGAVSVKRGGDGAMVLVIEYPEGTTPDARLITEALSGIPKPLQASSPSLLTPGQEVPFADLGFETAVSSEYYFRTEVNFRLPEDWLILASQQATAELDYGFAEGLPEGGLMLVKVNGTTVRMLPLDRNGGSIQPRLPVGFNARLLRPGVNALSFEAIIPGDPADQPCPVRTTDMLTILDSSSLTVPKSPRMQQPDMARILSGLDGGDVQVVGDAAARSLPFAATLQSLGSEAEAEGELVVAAFRDIPQMPLSHRGLTVRELETVLLPPAPVVVAPAQTPAPARPAQPKAEAEPARLERAAPNRTVALPSGLPDWLERAWTGLKAPIARGIDSLVHPGDGELAPWLAAQNGVAVLLSLEADRPERLWLVLAPGVDPVDVASDLDAGRRSAGGPHGQVSVLQRDGQWVSWTAADARPLLLEPLSVGNVRPVLGNLVSWQPRALTAAMLGLAWITALLALYFVVSTRRSRKR